MAQEIPTVNAPTFPPMTEAVAAQGGMWFTTYNLAGQASRILIEDAVAAGNTIASAIRSLTISRTFTTAEVLASNTTRLPFGIVCPTGYYVLCEFAMFRATFNGVAYATNTTAEVGTVGATRVQKQQNLLGFTADTQGSMATLAAQVNTTQYVEAADLEFGTLTGDPTAGDSDITIDIVYSLIPI